jgi:chemotaxis protein histidine kinase CheA
MTDEFSPEFQRELLDDFYTECDELFGTIRTQLTTLAERDTRPERERGAFETLHRSIHTLKGNCSIVGLRDAEQLTHAIEGAIGGTLNRTLNPGAPVLD